MAKTKRTGTAERTTRETSVKAEITLGGGGKASINTPVGFMNHMLELLARHARFDISVEASGDVQVDAHHTTEDVGIVLGEAFRSALGGKEGIVRFADARVPMQDSLAMVAVDLSGRPLLSFNAQFPTDKVGEFDVELVPEFLQAFVNNAGITLHVDLVRGSNSHHIAEAIFKATARALRAAVAIDPSAAGEVPSTKGTL
jgi:imidazoleglycerol-phosphate dehydratase